MPVKHIPAHATRHERALTQLHKLQYQVITVSLQEKLHHGGLLL